MSNNSNIPSQVISLPQGGGALHGIGEKFSPELHTGTGNFLVPIGLPPGRNGFQPQLNLAYSTGNGNGPFGFGWSLSVPGVSRKTSKGVPQYRDRSAKPEDWDTFILSGVEDLVPVPGAPAGATRYRPRTEGLFAQIDHHYAGNDDYWEVRSKDGLVSLYGTPQSKGNDPTVVADRANRSKVFAWKLTLTKDPFGNRIEYGYERDAAHQEGPHVWDQLRLSEIRYVDYGDPASPQFLVTVNFDYESRPDPYSEYRSGFEIRTVQRCTRVRVATHAGAETPVRTYHLRYLDQNDALSRAASLNGVSLLDEIEVEGHDGTNSEKLPALEFRYTRFQPEGRKFFPVTGPDMPGASLAHPDFELVDLFGKGLPDILEMNGNVRYWRNLGHGKFDRARDMPYAPAGLRLSDPGVQMVDADGDGRMDLLVTTPTLAGYFPLQRDGLWDQRSFQTYRVAPSFNLKDPEVRLVDLDGDGVTDAIRSGTRLECFFNDPHEGWTAPNTRWVERRSLDVFPDVNFSDPRVRWADMSGDGLQDILLLHNGSVDYWPNLGRGNWARRIRMRNSPRFPYGYDPKRVLVGDVDGDGLADIVYVDNAEVTLWINQSGNSWSNPIVIRGTPPVTDMDAVRLADMLGSGISGVLWTSEAGGLLEEGMFFLDFTDGVKPYLLNEMDNHMGATTKVEYAPSTRFYLEDQKRSATRWNTSLPFPVQVVNRVEVIDQFSRGKLTTEYRYHRGYWDGAEREFRGFGRVEQFDTETFEEYNKPGLHGQGTEFVSVREQFSPPMLTKTWFHQGPIGEEFGGWEEIDWSREYWAGDLQMLGHTEGVNNYLGSFLPGLPSRRVKRDAIRALRGSILRSELYALDGSQRQDRPYTVTEHCYEVREESAPDSAQGNRLHIFFPQAVAQRTTQWERGDDPMTTFTFISEYDEFGQPLVHTQIACPRGWRTPPDIPTDEYLATRTRTEYATPQAPDLYPANRVAKATTYEILNSQNHTVFELRDLTDSSPSFRIIGQTLNFYDPDPAAADQAAFAGLPFRRVGKYGALVRTENLVLTEDILQKAYITERPPYLADGGPLTWAAEYPADFRTSLPPSAGFLYHPGVPGSPYVPGYYAATERRRYDLHDSPSGRGLVTVIRDALNHDTTIAYDLPYFVFPSIVTDTVALQTTADYNYRVMQPMLVTDPNGNISQFVFNPLGLLQETWVQGKTGQEGDQVQPSVRMEYELRAVVPGGPPISVRTIRQVHHDTETDVPAIQRNETIETLEYSDGFGRVLQTRTQAEDLVFADATLPGTDRDLTFGNSVLPAAQPNRGGDAAGYPVADPVGTPRVMVSGQQIYDNKGRVVEKYEPFFAEGWDYSPPAGAQRGEKVAMFYDPRGHVIRAVNPDASEQRVIYGVPGTISAPDLTNPDVFEPTPWEAYTYDANDNAGRTHATTSAEYRHHWNTPPSILIDALGRTVKSVVRNRAKPANPGDPLPPIEAYSTQSTYDIHGNLLTVTDPLDRLAFQHVYDLAKNVLRMESIDAGIRRTVLDAVGNPVEQRDSKGALTLHAYDQLHRPSRLWAKDSANELLTLRQILEYGDGGDPNQPPSERAGNRQNNRLGRLYEHYDEAGLLTHERYDFKANILEKTRRVVRDQKILAVFATANAANGWQVSPFRMNWTPPGISFSAHADALLELAADAYRTTMRYDALNRVKRLQYPRDVDGTQRVLSPHYNRAGAIERIDMDGAAFVEHIAYNARGQRTLIAYGNEILTRHTYDPQTFRLRRLRTESYSQPGQNVYRPEGAVLQDLAYDYDVSGNILTLRDRTPSSGIPNTLLGLNALDRGFTYDPLYRLITANGRECDMPSPPDPWDPGPRCQDPTQVRRYAETYQYDPAGNLRGISHQSPNGSYAKDFSLVMDLATGQPASNRLAIVQIDATPFAYTYDPAGNLTGETLSRHFEWDYADRLRVFRTQAPGAPSSEYAHYLYDGSGRRVMKLVRAQGGGSALTVYIDGVFEHHRWTETSVSKENNRFHVMDNQSRVALVRTGDRHPDDGGPDVQYHLGDHLGSSHLVLGGTIASSNSFINSEEYFPYGGTSFGSFTRKRYRFTGGEHDEESALYYHGARYYAPSLARWVSADPAGRADGLNVYAYAKGQPLRYSDPSGTQAAPPQSNSTADPQAEEIKAPGESARPSEAVPTPEAPPAQVRFVDNVWLRRLLVVFSLTRPDLSPEEGPPIPPPAKTFKEKTEIEQRTKRLPNPSPKPAGGPDPPPPPEPPVGGPPEYPGYLQPGEPIRSAPPKSSAPADTAKVPPLYRLLGLAGWSVFLFVTVGNYHFAEQPEEENQIIKDAADQAVGGYVGGLLMTGLVGLVVSNPAGWVLLLAGTAGSYLGGKAAEGSRSGEGESPSPSSSKSSSSNAHMEGSI